MIYNENENNYEDNSFESEGKTVHYKHKVLDKKIEQEFLHLSDKDKEFIQYSLGDAQDLLTLLPEKKSLSDFTAKDLDILIYLWNNKKRKFDHFTEAEFANAIGAAFGHYLNREVDTIWTIVNDEYGTDYSCIGKTHRFQLYPFSSVWKAIEQNREDSLNAIVLIVKNNKEEYDKR